MQRGRVGGSARRPRNAGPRPPGRRVDRLGATETGPDPQDPPRGALGALWGPIRRTRRCGPPRGSQSLAGGVPEAPGPPLGGHQRVGSVVPRLSESHNPRSARRGSDAGPSVQSEPRQTERPSLPARALHHSDLVAVIVAQPQSRAPPRRKCVTAPDCARFRAGGGVDRHEEVSAAPRQESRSRATVSGIRWVRMPGGLRARSAPRCGRL